VLSLSKREPEGRIRSSFDKLRTNRIRI